ncbi:Small ribosomal subunit biogenesis GTPase RsgA [Trichinella spiralis]|uniref:Small ribosomal subunit biogenesis GTPase RsgA n=1 Tax=Trichinella spiralis TaxID=6334 RepID=A0ABR3K8G7_TRISP
MTLKHSQLSTVHLNFHPIISVVQLSGEFELCTRTRRLKMRKKNLVLSDGIFVEKIQWQNDDSQVCYSLFCWVFVLDGVASCLDSLLLYTTSAVRCQRSHQRNEIKLKYTILHSFETCIFHKMNNVEKMV